MPYQEDKTDCEHRRSLRLALDFLDASHPVSGERMSLVNGLRDQLKSNPTQADVFTLADAVETTAFTLRRGVVKALPGLAANIRRAAGASATP